MATSGQIGQMKLTLQEILDAAFRACRVVPQNITAEMIHNAKGSLQRLLNSLPATVTLPLWAQDRQLLSFRPGIASLDLPVGSIDVISMYRRTWGRYDHVLTSTVNQHALDLSEMRDIDVIGFLPAQDIPGDINISISTDGISYFEPIVNIPGPHKAGVVVWHEIERPLKARFVFISGFETAFYGDAFVGAGVNDREIERVNMDVWTGLPRNRKGPPLQAWVDRQVNGPVLQFWPVPDIDSQWSALSVYRKRQIQDVGSMAQEIEIPARWEKGIIVMLAYEIAFDTPQIDISIVNMLTPKAEAAKREISNDEPDSAPINIYAGISGYTR